MTPADFVHLRVHSAYSLSEGAIKPEKIAGLAKADGQPAVGIADSGNLFGALEFSQACVAKGVQPIIGCQISLARTDKAGLPADPVVLLAQDEVGLGNLRALSSMGFIESDPVAPQIEVGRLFDHSAGLILLTGGTRGPIVRLLAEGRKPEAEALLAQFGEAFPGRCMMELHRHGLAIERAVEPGLIGLADALRMPLVATNECFFATPGMHEAHDALLCIAEGRQVSEQGRRRVTPEHWFKPAAAMAGGVCGPAGRLRQYGRGGADVRGDGGEPEAAAAGQPEGAGGADGGCDDPRDGSGGARAADGRDGGGRGDADPVWDAAGV